MGFVRFPEMVAPRWISHDQGECKGWSIRNKVERDSKLLLTTLISGGIHGFIPKMKRLSWGEWQHSQTTALCLVKSFKPTRAA